MMWGWNDGWGFAWGLHWIFPLLVVALIAWAVIVLTRSAGGRREKESDGTRRALAIARERYARGEIDREEFETLRKDLS
jgi:putative membrane protein